MWKYTHEQMVEIYDKIGLILDDIYINMHVKLNCHDNDGYKFYSSPMDVRDEVLPEKFHSNNPYTISNINNYISINSITTSLLSKTYKNNSTHLLWKCDCGEEYTASWNKFLQGQQCCERCSYRNTCKKDIGILKKMFSDRNCILLSTECYTKRDKLEYICNKHKNKGSQFISITDFDTLGKGCKYCGFETIGTQKRIGEDGLKELTENKGFIYVGVDYDKNQSARISYICPKHREVGVQKRFLSTMRNVTKGVCSYCAGYSGELLLHEILDGLDIIYDKQKRFKDCIDKRQLPFDVYLVDYNIAVEYDGEFHYMPIQINGIDIERAKENMRETQRRDLIKTNYCKDNNIGLIRIPYWEKKNMKSFLYNELLKYNLNINIA